MILVDLETRSRVDLPTRGGVIYASDPSTEILTFAWQDTENANERGVWLPGLAVRPPESAIKACLKDVPVYVGQEFPPVPLSVPWAAHNAWGFDQLVWEGQGLPNPLTWIDTAPLARACGLPGGLEAIGKTLRGEGKHKEGRGHLKKFMGYQKEPRAGDLLLIAQYCWDDTGGLLWDLWKHLEKKRKQGVFVEPDVIEADRQINQRGIRLDSEFAIKLLQIGDVALKRCLERISIIAPEFQTLDDLRKLPKVHAWLAKHGIPKMSLARGAIKEWLERMDRADEDGDDQSLSGDDEDDDGGAEDRPVRISVRPSEEVLEFLTLRGLATKITAHKVNAAMNSRHQGRLQWLLAYGAAHTGRWGGRRLQPQNLPQPHKDVEVWKAVHIVETEENPVEKLDALLAGTGATLEDVCGSLIRGILLPEPGESLSCVDYNAIEFRGAGWLVNEPAILNTFRDGIDPYGEMAYKIFGRRPAHKKDPVRQVGKVVCLGSIYQLGPDRLDGYALSQGVNLGDAGTTSEICIDVFRDAHPMLAGIDSGRVMKDGRKIRYGGFWKDVNAAAIEAVQSGSSSCARLQFHLMGDDLHMVLPSGRPLVYRKAFVAPAMTKFGKLVDSVHYFSPRGFTNTLYGGKITENAVQASCRDLLAAAIVRCHRAGIRVLLHVHDEIVASVRDNAEALLVGQLMAEKPAWAMDFPMACEGEVMPRYAKAAPKGAYTF